MAAPWHHSPLHVLSDRGVYMVTAGTYQKKKVFAGAARLKSLHDLLHENAREYGWQLRAWSVFPNHYHFVALSPEDASSLRPMISKLHTFSARLINEEDNAPGRKVWHQFWDTRLTFDHSYLARLNYVHHNPVHHRVVTQSTDYPWCSAGWFETEAAPAFQRTVKSMPIDRLNVIDDF